jgi:RNA polymerase sigma-70 factor (ECF subfamily)
MAAGHTGGVVATTVDEAIETGEALGVLVRRVAAGERAAETVLLARFGRGVRALARSQCRPNDPAAEDIAQDVLIGVLERIRAGAIVDPLALPAYLRTAVVHAASAEYRRRRDRGGTLSVDAVVDLDNGEPGPPQRLAAAQLAALLQRLLPELPVPRDREVLRRFYLLEQDKDAVCADLAIDESHFHRVVHRARQRFREILSRHGIGPVSAGPTSHCW